MSEKKTRPQGPYTEEIESADSESEAPGSSKKLRKKQAKEERRERRKLKKELKLAFQSQNKKLVRATTTEAGALKSGVSVKKIY